MKISLMGKSSIGFPFFLFFFSMASYTYGQNMELGFGAGTFNYTGDLAPTYEFRNQRPAFTVFYGYNISKAVTFRVSATAGFLHGNDTRPADPFGGSRDSSFSAIGQTSEFNIFLFEAATTFEYHFMDWRSERSMLRWTPYLFGGFGFFSISGIEDKSADYSTIQPSFPLGIGFKYIISPRWYLGLEFGARFTFFDHLDNISSGDHVDKNFRYGNWRDNDKYYFLGLKLTYAFYDIPCPKNPY